MWYTHKCFNNANEVDTFLNIFSSIGYNLSEYIISITDKNDGRFGHLYTIFYKTNDEINKKLKLIKT